MDVASGADRHLDITFGLQVVLFREMFSHPYISFFHLLVNGFSVIRECSSTLYVGLARAVPSPTNTNSGPEEAQRLQRFWPLHHLAFIFLNLSIMLTCHVMCSLHKLLCILVLCIMYYCVFVDYDYT